MSSSRQRSRVRRFEPADEQTAHPTSGPRRRPHELPESSVIRGNSRRTTHVNCPPRIPVRFTFVIPVIFPKFPQPVVEMRNGLQPAGYQQLPHLDNASLDAVEFATLEWVDWFNHRRLLEPIGYLPPAEYEERYYQQAAVA